MEKITPEATINDVNRKPLAYALMILGALVSFFVGVYVFSQNRSSSSCETEKAQLRADLNAERERTDRLTRELLVKQGVIDKVKTDADSLVRTK